MIYALALAFCLASTTASIRLECQRPFMYNAIITPRDDYYVYKVGTRLTISCSSGFMLFDRMLRRHVKGNAIYTECKIGGMWYPDVGRYLCDVRGNTCDKPQGEGLIVTPNKETYQRDTAVDFSCEKGYTLRGRRTGFCLPSGVFYPSPPECIRSGCGNPGKFENGVFTPNKESYAIWERIEYKCNPGYEIEGKPWRICNEKNIFDSPPICRPIKCPVPMAPDFGSVSPQQKDYFYNVVITYSCNDGYMLVGAETATCLQTGVFSASRPTCSAITCDNPGAPLNGIVVRAKLTYDIGEEIQWGCMTGYTLAGSETAMCQEDGSFSEDIPTCTQVTCGSIRGPINGEVVPMQKSYQVGAIVTFVCDDGYKLDSNIDESTCMADGEFNNMAPNCRRVTCSSPIAPENGSIVSRKTVYNYGDVVTYRCDPGYILEGFSESTCQSDGTYSNMAPTCRPVRCNKPRTPRELSVEPSRPFYLYQDRITYVCADGYIIRGFASDSCGEDGEFSNQLPSCERITCRRPLAPLNGAIVDMQITYYYDDEVTYECNTGYELQGDMTRMCMSDGEFDGEVPTCEPTSCSRPDVPENGGIVPDQTSYQILSRIEWVCDPGFTLQGARTARCQPNQRFSAAAPRCRRVTCSVPRAPINGFIVSVQVSYVFEDVIEYDCKPGYTLVGVKVQTCNEEGEFTGAVPICRAITCNNPGAPVDGYISPDRPSYAYNSAPITWACDEGYRLVGDKFANCQEDGTFDKNVPTCQRVSCGRAPTIENGNIVSVQVEYLFGDSIEYACVPGYKISGVVSNKCGSNGFFLYKEPTCTRIACTLVIAPDQGFIFQEQTVYYYEDVVTYRCNIGYELVGSETNECGAEGELIRAVPRCERATCRRPSVLRNGRIEPRQNSYDIGVMVQWECNPGYYIQGSESAECTRNGFSQQTPECIPMSCSAPEEIDNGRYIPRSPTIAYNERVTYICDDGYTVVGSKTITCVGQNKYSDPVPRCQKITCSKPLSSPNSQYTPDRSVYSYLDVITYECDEGYMMSTNRRTRMCEITGTFSSNIPTCERITCNNPGAPINGDIEPRAFGSYNYNAVVTWECDDGYTLIGAESAVCQGNGRFSESVPECKRVSCGAANRISNGFVLNERPVYYAGDTATYQCNDGYIIDGDRSVTCGDDGNFEEPLPSCERITCDEPMVPDNGRILVEQTVYYYGDLVTYICNVGYELIGLATVQCTMNGFSGQVPFCRKLTCDNPGRPRYGSISPDYPSYEVSTRITWSCNEGYELEGDDTAMCRGNGDFDKDVPTCRRIQCPVPMGPMNGGVSDPINRNYVNYGETVTYFCERGYELAGNEVATCKEDGELSPEEPTCERRSCSNPGPPANGNISPDRPSYGIGVRITWSCIKGYELEGYEVAMCGNDGSFNNPRPTCRKIRCPIPMEPLNGRITRPRGQQYVDYGETVSYACDPGYQLSGDDTSTCQENGELSPEQPTCEKRSCSNPGAPTNGKISPDRVSYAIGIRITWSCSPGYELEGYENAMCGNDGSFNNPRPTCRKIRCPIPMGPENGQVARPRGRQFVDYGETVTYVCDAGFQLVGNAVSTCQENGELSPEQPTCEERNCLNPGAPSNGKISPDRVSYAIGIRITWSCSPGYELEGYENAMCGNDGSFNNPRPTCRKIRCPIPMGPTNGRVTRPRNRDYVDYGETVAYACDPGYQLAGNDVSTCQEDGTLSPEQPTCEQRSCSNPGAPANGGISPNRVSYAIGVRITWSCSKGFELEGYENAMCGNDGSFNNPRPFCRKIRCPIPMGPVNGQVARPRNQEYVQYLETVTYACDPGYQLAGNAVSTCQEDGELSPEQPTCERRSCSNPGAPANGDISPDRVSYAIGIRITWSCSPGYELEGYENAMCGNDGSFNNPRPTCRKIRCPVPMSPENGRITRPVNAEYVEYGGVVIYVCNVGYSLVGIARATCQEDGTLSSERPTCQRVTCLNPGSPVNGGIRPDVESYAVTTRVTWFCEDGYELVGLPTAMCQGNRQFSNPVPSCRRNSCGEAQNILNGEIIDQKPEYFPGDMVSYRCNEGYQLIGIQSIRCTADGSYAPAAPMCKRIECEKPKSPANGFIQNVVTVYYYGDEITFVCNAGFQLVGDKTSTCREDGFDNVAPTCQRRSCANPGKPENGNIVPDRPNYGVNVRITWTCRRGYRRVGSTNAVCQNNGNFNNKPPTCERIQCKVPEEIEFGRVADPVDQDYVGYLETVTYVCNNGYTLVGKAKATCGINGQLSSKPPTCTRVQCRNPGKPINGKITPDLEVYSANARISWSCEKGYRIVGLASAICTPNGNFNNKVPTCKKVQCRVPRPLTNGRIPVPRYPEQFVEYQGTVKYVCNDGYVMKGKDTATCGAGGQFSSPKPTCTRVRCKNPGKPNNGDIRPYADNYNYDAVVTWTCNQGFALVGSETAKCLDTGLFSALAPTCKQIFCDVSPIRFGFTLPRGVRRIQYRQSITYNCNKGFTMVGKAKADCLITGELNEEPPTCRPQTCNRPTLSPFGSIDEDKPVYAFNEKVTYSCVSGYKLVGKITATCVAGGFDNDPPRCEEMSCDYPGKPLNGNTRPVSTRPDGKYAVNTIVFYSCNEGYTLVGASIARCQDDGEFSEQPPRCDAVAVVKCATLGRPENGFISDSDRFFSIGDTVTFRCSTGYVLVGAPSSTCMADGEFDNARPTCERICFNPGSPEHGSISSLQTTFTVGETVTYTCSQGYVLVGARTSRCTRDGTFFPAMPRCRSRSCAFPGNPTNGRTVPYSASYEIGNSVLYECNDGYETNEPISAICEPNGEFSNDPPTCFEKQLVQCRNPGRPQNGDSSNSDPFLSPGDVIEFECDPCYELAGRRMITCMQGGNFNAQRPSCIAKVCVIPRIPKNGFLLPLEKNYTCGEVVTFGCHDNEGYTLSGAGTATCQAGGEWSEPSPDCRPKACKRPPSLTNGRISPSYNRDYWVGEKITFSCRPGFRLTGSKTAVCESDGGWSSRPQCRAILCSVPEAPANGDVETLGAISFGPGSSIEYSCNNHYTLIGEPFSVCGNDGKWSSPAPNCQSPSCAHQCGLRFNAAKPCQCDGACGERGDCCSDYADKCEAFSCRGKCGNRKGENGLQCDCDGKCVNAKLTAALCCRDFLNQCDWYASSFRSFLP